MRKQPSAAVARRLFAFLAFGILLLAVGCWLLAVGYPSLSPFCPTQVARSEAKGRGQFGARFFAYFLMAGTPVAR